MLKITDYKILFELDNNSRQSYGELAKALRTSKQVVGYHLKALVKEGYIKKFLTIFDLTQLGFILHKVYLRLVRASEKDELEIIDFLKNNQNVAWLVRTEGIYDIAFALHTKDVHELNNILLELENKYGEFILEKIVNRVLSGEFFHRDYFVLGKKGEFRKRVTFQTQQPAYKLDEIDWEIIAALASDARTPVVEIAKKLPITPDAVSKRLKNLEKKGVIRKYILVVDDSKLEQLHYKILLRVTHFTEQLERKFIEFCSQNPNITFYNKNIGFWEFELDMEVKTSAHFREIMRLLKKEFADSIKEYFSLIIYDIIKFDFVPMKIK